MPKTKLITLTIEQAEEVMEAFEWAIDEYDKQDDIDKATYKTYRSTYYSIQNQLKELVQWLKQPKKNLLVKLITSLI